MIRLYKTKNITGIGTDCKDASTFLRQFGELLGHMRNEVTYQDALELQLGSWLPHVVEICCKLKGHNADVTERGGWLYACNGEGAAMVATTEDIPSIKPSPPARPHLQIVP